MVRLVLRLMQSRRATLSLAAMVVAVLITVVLVQASELPPILGTQDTFAPVHITSDLFVLAIALGFCSGLITGTIGIGGGFILTPALMSLGIRGILAVGTDMFYIFAAAIIGGAAHKRLGNISVPLVAAFSTGSLLGVNSGAGLNKSLYAANPPLSDLVITSVYIVLLGILATYSSYLLWRSVRSAAVNGGLDAPVPTRLARKVQSVGVRPLITVDKGKSVSAWIVVLCGFMVGFVASIMGVGGGFLSFPLYVYVLGIPPATTVGTCLVQVILTAGYAAIFKYAVHGFVVYGLAVSLLIGSLVGVQLGSMTIKVIQGYHIQGFYATTVLAGFVNRLLALPEKLSQMGYVDISRQWSRTLSAIGTGAFFVLIVFFSVWVLALFLCNLPRLRQVDEDHAAARRR